jgi:DNA replication protein DnaC
VTTPEGMQDPYELWRAEERERRLRLFHAKRPAAFAAKGQLDARVHRWLESLVAGNARTLLLGGPTGTGKTWSAWKAIETLLANDWRGGWAIISAYELSRVIAPPVDEDRLDHLARTDLLVIDDLGSVAVTDWAAAHLLGLVDHRWARHLPTLVTTNTQRLGEVVGERVASRLGDGAVSIALDGPDRRRPR